MMSLSPFPDQNRPDRAVIALQGEAVVDFLNGLLTCELNGLGDGMAAYGALLSPQGKIQHDVFVYRDGEHILLDVAAEQRAALLQKLALYRLRAKIALEMNNDLEIGVHAERPEGVLAFADPRCADLGYRSFASVGSFINVPVHRGYDTRRIALGLADSVRDIGSDQMFPHEVNFDQFRGVSFSKGCYVGQEVVSRMQHRGTARNRMLPVTFKVRPSQNDVMRDGTRIGEMHSMEEQCGLALLRIDKLAGPPMPLMAGDVELTIAKPAWISYAVAL